MSLVGDVLFTRTQQRVLGLLYGAPGKSFYTNEIVRRAGVGRGTVQRELERLTAAGLLVLTREGNQSHYQANFKNPIFQELTSIVRKTFGIADVVRQSLEPGITEIQLAFIYGSIAKHEETAASDIDLLLISDNLQYGDAMTMLAPAEETLGRKINPSIYMPAQMTKKIREKNAFITRILEQPKLWIKGTDDDIGKLG